MLCSLIYSSNQILWSPLSLHSCFKMAHDSILALNTMAQVLGMPEDAVHWNETSGMNFWTSEKKKARYHAEWDNPKNWNITSPTAFNWLDIASLGIEDVNREWVEQMGRVWLANSTYGHYDIVPLSSVPLKNYHKDDDTNGNPRCPLGTDSASAQCTGGVDKVSGRELRRMRGWFLTLSALRRTSRSCPTRTTG